MNIVPIVLTAVSLIGVIGLVDDVEAMIHEYSLNEIFENCDNSDIEIALHDSLKLINTSNEPLYIQEGNTISTSEIIQTDYRVLNRDNIKTKTADEYNANKKYLEPDGYILLIAKDIGSHEFKFLPKNCIVDGEWSSITKRIIVHHENTDERIINLIARTFNLTPSNQPDRTTESNDEQIQKLKEKNKELKNKHGACNDDKKRTTNELNQTKTELSELQRLYQIMNTTSIQQLQTISEHEQTIEKLTQELNNATKKIEELESP